MLINLYIFLYDSFFEEATRNVGLYYQSDLLWSMYIEHETRNKNWSNVARVYTNLFSSPVRGIETFFDQ